jgi:DNA-binding SARP family transcriptional activator
LRYRILGPLRLCQGGASLAVGPAKQRTLLAVLLLKANQVVSTERLMVELWHGPRPATALKAVQVYVSKLRRLLGDEHGHRLQTCPPGRSCHYP